ncbi:MAG: hypothetical protein EBU04_10795 [Verrucomicrobia bacterium]|nr:hypothetical protein [Verrucomicrobiota bacterium]
MELTIRVKTADDDYTVSTTLFNIVQLERKYKTTASALQTGVSVAGTYRRGTVSRALAEVLANTGYWPSDIPFTYNDLTTVLDVINESRRN